jgi:hypothetical protein
VVQRIHQNNSLVTETSTLNDEENEEANPATQGMTLVVQRIHQNNSLVTETSTLNDKENEEANPATQGTVVVTDETPVEKMYKSFKAGYV